MRETLVVIVIVKPVIFFKIIIVLVIVNFVIIRVSFRAIVFFISILTIQLILELLLAVHHVLPSFLSQSTFESVACIWEVILLSRGRQFELWLVIRVFGRSLGILFSQ